MKIFDYLKRNSGKLVILVFVAFIFILPVASLFADGYTCDPTKQICNPINVTSVNGLIKTILEGVLTIGIPIIALAIIYCGFLFVAARGKPEALKKAKDALLYTLIGAAILLGAWAIAQLITNTVIGVTS